MRKTALMMRKTALITGASAGIGLELCKVFAGNGYNIVLVSRNRQKLEQVARELENKHYLQATVIPKDLCEPTAPQALYDEIAAMGIVIDVLVNNAAFGLYGRFTDFSVRRHMGMIQVNITALTVLCKLFGADMVKKGAGSILNVASTAAFQAGPLLGSYYASKAYVLMLSEAMNSELRKDGVTVTALCPGPTQTEFFERNDMIGTNVAKSPWLMSAADVAAAGYAGLIKKKCIVIPGFFNKLLAFSVRLSPRWLPAEIVCYLNRKK
ncbi:MAG: SDR family oxidoreductase [Desulfobacteraceae bacterium]|nr:SDR family oxidoreductase [Desulfobacteraceae bacterium]MBC2756304.1 SDR family oxidoreductase [Desulfobacteraceae bacterium]